MSRATAIRPSRSEKKQPDKSQISTFGSAVNYLDSLTNYERVPRARYTPGNFGLSRMGRLLSAMGNPHRSFKSVHIVGTKGKGSTAVMTAEMLRACGYRVGLYTSPHVLQVRERIVVDGSMISEGAFAKGVAAVAALTKKARLPAPTYFEILTAAAFQFFATKGVDIAVIETGMGGRLDATNVILPEVVGLVGISLDHAAQLGDNLPAIAREKVGVFKKGVPVISAPQRPEVREVVQEAAAELDVPLVFASENVGFSYRFEFSREIGRHARICLTTPTSRFEHVLVPLMGEHQASTCAVALRIVDTLKSRGFKIDDQQAQDGLNNVNLSGRMQIVSETPRILVDGAHNAASIDALIRGIGQHIAYDSMIVIFGCQKDKDIHGMLRRLQLGADKMIFTSTRSPRSADPAELAAEYTEISGKMAQVGRSLSDALAIATSAISREDLICITGSFYLVGQAVRKFSGKRS